jgi:hypothetical protein
MMKRWVAILTGLVMCTSFSYAATVWQDGFITAGEYAVGVIWNNYYPPLIVEGGGSK